MVYFDNAATTKPTVAVLNTMMIFTFIRGKTRQRFTQALRMHISF